MVLLSLFLPQRLALAQKTLHAVSDTRSLEGLLDQVFILQLHSYSLVEDCKGAVKFDLDCACLCLFSGKLLSELLDLPF